MIKALVKDDKDLNKDAYWITLPSDVEEYNKLLKELKKQQIYILRTRCI